MTEARHDQLVRAAWLYHEGRLTQGEVASRLGVSRSTVSRLLTEAESTGIVEVTITVPLPEASHLSDALSRKFGLRRAVVGMALGGGSPMDSASAAMAREIERTVAHGPVTIAAGWGRTLAGAAARTRPRSTTGVTFADAVGHATSDEIAPAVDVTNTCARRFGAEVVHIPSPGFAPNASVRDALLASTSVAEALRRARSADVTFTSIGVVGATSLLVTEGFLSRRGMADLVAAGAVGEILGRYYDAAGAEVPSDALHPIGLTLADLRDADRVVGAAGGPEKAAAVKAAILGGLLDEIVVDETLARALLES